MPPHIPKTGMSLSSARRRTLNSVSVLSGLIGFMAGCGGLTVELRVHVP